MLKAEEGKGYGDNIQDEEDGDLGARAEKARKISDELIKINGLITKVSRKISQNLGRFNIHANVSDINESIEG